MEGVPGGSEIKVIKCFVSETSNSEFTQLISCVSFEVTISGVFLQLSNYGVVSVFV